MTTVPNTHETAQAITPGARVAYVDVHNHSVPEFASFFGPLDLVPPGVVDSREWRPDWEQPVHLPPRDGQVIVGVARVG
jgi:S-adenosyl methyltransferase